MPDTAPTAEYLRSFFDFDHLPVELQRVAEPCANLADDMMGQLPDEYELRYGLRQPLLARDAFIRAAERRDRRPL